MMVDRAGVSTPRYTGRGPSARVATRRRWGGKVPGTRSTVRTTTPSRSLRAPFPSRSGAVVPVHPCTAARARPLVAGVGPAAPSGDLLGYTLARPGDVTAAEDPVFYSGSAADRARPVPLLPSDALTAGPLLAPPGRGCPSTPACRGRIGMWVDAGYFSVAGSPARCRPRPTAPRPSISGQWHPASGGGEHRPGRALPGRGRRVRSAGCLGLVLGPFHDHHRPGCRVLR